MALATSDDVKARLGRDLKPDEVARAAGLLDEASDLVVGFLRPRAVPDPAPDVVRRVVSRMVARVLESTARQAGVASQQMTAGPYQLSNTFVPDSTSGGPWLTKADKIALRSLKLGAFSVRTW